MATQPSVTSLAAARLLPAAQKRLKSDVNTVFKGGADRIRALLLSHAPDGSAIRKRDEAAVVRAAGDIIMSLFVGPDGRSAFAADGVTALAPYPALLNIHLAVVQAQAVRVHQRWLEKRLPEDVLRWLQGARPPEDSLDALSEQRRAEDVLNAAYRRRVLAAYDRAHTFVDPNGYVLSDRIWRGGVATRARIDAMLAEGIRNGTGSLDLSNLLERFLLPTRAALRTRKPYGRDASFDGMRLARTEITAAFGRTTVLSAQLNPFVTQVIWRLSASHPRIDICDALASQGPYDPDRVPPYPPHPQCVTPGQLVRTSMGDKPIETIAQGDMVLTHSGEYKPVNWIWSKHYNGNVYEVVTGDGCFEVTGNHPILTSRGWVNADQLQLGDQVLYATKSVALDLLPWVSVSSPPMSSECFVSSFIPHGVVPVLAVAFNRDFVPNNSEVDEVAPNPILLIEHDAEVLQRLRHLFFECGAPLVKHETALATETFVPPSANLACISLSTVEADANLLILASHGVHEQVNQAGVVHLFGSGNLGSDLWPLGRILIPDHIQPQAGFGHLLRCSVSACAIVSSPCVLDAFGNTECVHIAHMQQITEGTECNVKDGAYFGTTKSLSDIEIGQNVSDRSIEISFDPDLVPLDYADALNTWMACAGVLEAFAANGASVTWGHDDLLSSPPDVEMGTGSGKPGVERVANPLQAQGYYSKVTAINQRSYNGPVYNMEVEDTHSYTVGGAVVHNCLCSLIPQVGDIRAIIGDLRLAMEAGEDAPFTPAAGDAFLLYLLGAILFRLVQQWEAQDAQAA